MFVWYNSIYKNIIQKFSLAELNSKYQLLFELFLFFQNINQKYEPSSISRWDICLMLAQRLPSNRMFGGQLELPSRMLALRLPSDLAKLEVRRVTTCHAFSCANSWLFRNAPLPLVSAYATAPGPQQNALVSLTARAELRRT